jgi:hypothetical protein
MSPVSRYYGGHGKTVMADFKRRYGSKGGTRAFYAVVNKMRKGSPAQRAAQPRFAPGSRRKR